MVEIIVPGKPIAKKRPRFVANRYGKGGHAYNDQQTEEGKFLLLCLGTIKEKFDCALSMRCCFVFDRPKSHFGTGKNAGVLKTSAPAHHTGKPDIDNLLKFVCDSLNNVAFRDDSQIVNKFGSKRYAEAGEESRTEIRLEEVAG